MTLDEAIRVDTVLIEAPVLKNDPLVVKALQISIEALKRCKAIWDSPHPQPRQRLPGETED